ncbi:MAG: M48 family metallopeptidase, partial [Verrucomicrobiota bacterium]
MDFFESQDQARRKSRWLILYFLLAIAGIVGSVYLAAIGVSHFVLKSGSFQLWQADTFLWVTVVTVIVIFGGSGFKTLQLSGGGSVVALDLGGRRVDTDTTDTYERRLLNVVEEMAIASGVPVPDVYVLEREEGINAFAAGKTSSDAVVGVTRGCMTLLSRDELQAVVAHEFSHILNGDMRLNLRLIGLLHGILIVSILGQILMRVMGEARWTSSSRDDRGGGAALFLGLLVFGLALWAIGAIGVFFGRMIKSAVSRQREFLADASAVQFTRNPDGMTGALKKIGAHSQHGLLKNPRAEEASHLFFSTGITNRLSAALATHPPLETRIERIDPSWDGRFPTLDTTVRTRPPVDAGREYGAAA